jgi:hypothetical protein
MNGIVKIALKCKMQIFYGLFVKCRLLDSTMNACIFRVSRISITTFRGMMPASSSHISVICRTNYGNRRNTVDSDFRTFQKD